MIRSHERHQALVARLVADGFRTNGFRKELASAIAGRRCEPRCACAAPPCAWRESLNEIRLRFPRIADGFRFHVDSKRVEIAEVVVTHDLKPDKIAHIRGLGAWLNDRHQWRLDIVHVGIEGTMDVEPWSDLGTNAMLFRLVAGIVHG